MPSSVIAVAEADVEMVSLDTRAERQRQLIRHAQELHHLNLAAARQGLRERTAQADTAKVRCEIARVEAEAVRLKLELAREALREARAKADLAELQLEARKRELYSGSPTDGLDSAAPGDEIKMTEEPEDNMAAGGAAILAVADEGQGSAVVFISEPVHA